METAFTGHPLVDVGICTLTAFAGRTDPVALAADDLSAAADFLERIYTQPGAMRRFAKGVIFLNAGYTSSADPGKQRIYADRVLRSWREGSPRLNGTGCAFCGQPAAYRANREDMPLLNGRDVFNFSPAGQAGLPVCGVCSLAIHMMPLGCVSSGGRLIAVQASSPHLTMQFARNALKQMRRAATLSEEEAFPKAPFERTRLVEFLIELLISAERGSLESAIPSVTGYFFTNTGQSASVQIYTLESHVVAFLESVCHHADLSLTAAWNRAVARAWLKNERSQDADPAIQRNALYEALLELPQGAQQVLRKFLLPTRHWGLAALFVTEVMGMDESRIRLLKVLGERLAAYIAGKRAFFYTFSRTEEYSKWRRALLRAADDHKRSAGENLITFDEFVLAFTAPPGEINDWRLARDLVTLALIEARGAEGDALFQDDETGFGTLETDEDQMERSEV